MVAGTLIAESLELDRDLTVPLTLRRLYRIAISTPTQDQPEQWTFIDFTCLDDDADPLAEQIAAALKPGHWYCDFATTSTKYVVFATTIFRFPRGDHTANAQALEHGRRAGVPEAQLDWPL